MPVSKAKKLSSIFRSAFKATSSLPTNTVAAAAAEEQYVASLETPSTPATCLINLRKGSKIKTLKSSSSKSILGQLSLDKFNLGSAQHHSDDSGKVLSQEISTILCGDTSSSTVSLSDSSLDNVLEIPWDKILSQNSITLRRKEISRNRKQKWVFKDTQSRRFERLVNMCAEKLGTDATINVFGKLGRETGVKEYNALIGLCIKKSKEVEDEEVTLEQIYKAYQLFKSMREEGFQLEEETYGQFLTFLIDMEMVEEFNFFCGVIRDENPNSLPRLAYYEMLLWVRLDDEDKIKEHCDFAATNGDTDNSSIRENYFLALCESERKKELLMLLDFIEITKVSSMGHLATIFRSLARLLLESHAKKFILALKSCDIGAENISKLIYDYAITVPNLAVEDAILKFESLHEELEVMPVSASCEKLIEHCCTVLKVHTALDIIDHMFEVGLTLSLETFHLMLHTCEESCDYNLVHRIYSVICVSNLKPNNETFRIMIYLSVRMKDFEGAYNMIKDMEKMSMMPTASIYNAIMAAHFREKNIQAGLMVLKEMERALVKPDSQTFSYLITNSDREEDIIKYYEEVKLSGVQITKHVFMALINAYASCGQLEKAKQVVSEKGISVKNLNEVKSVLVSALASHGHVSDALDVYEEIKKAECRADPKTTLCLIEYLQSKGNLSKLLDLLDDLKDTDYWIEGCCRVILYCVQCEDLRSTIDLLKQLKDKFWDDDIATEVLFDEAFCKVAEMKHVDMQFGLDLLQSIKEELGVRPSRKNLDFLLSACISAKDPKAAFVIWKEYEAAGLPYNGLAYLRMYQVLLACGDHESARKMLKKIPSDDPHVRCVIKACKATYTSTPKKKKVETSL